MTPSDDETADERSAAGRPDVERRAGGDDVDERGDTPDFEGADVTTAGGDADTGRIETDDDAFAVAKRTVDRATEEDDDEAAERLLCEAREELAAAESAPVEAVEKLDRRIDRLLAATRERDHYGVSMGASMDPDDEDAP